MDGNSDTCYHTGDTKASQWQQYGSNCICYLGQTQKENPLLTKTGKPILPLCEVSEDLKGSYFQSCGSN